MEWLNRLQVGRGLIIIGFLAGYNSISATVRHLGNDVFLLVAASPNGPAHSWHHFLRELGGDFGAMAAILLIIFAAPRNRTSTAWWVMLILMIGFYAPFWVGTPFNSAYGAPNMSAEINHLMMAIPTLIGCFVIRSHFRGVEVAKAPN
ncbi:MAG: hypothetical protein P8M72_06010 [Gammaproteobacteria bacterium]|nr:hypothetical protein [Gammaproteobacteria bacterium]